MANDEYFWLVDVDISVTKVRRTDVLRSEYGSSLDKDRPGVIYNQRLYWGHQVAFSEEEAKKKAFALAMLISKTHEKEAQTYAKLASFPTMKDET